MDPIQSKYRKLMNRVAKALDTTFNGSSKQKKVAFVLLTAEFGVIEDGRVNYISNGNREDMIAMMKEWLARAEGRYTDGSETAQ